MRNVFTPMTTAGLLLASLTQLAAAETPPDQASRYAGQENRTIKSLSADDIAELQQGTGWGLARTAELNGLPGPAHLLELKDELGLTVEQTGKIQAIYDQMKADAIRLGHHFMTQEFELERRFQTEIPNVNELKSMLETLRATRSQLRFVHLAAHLKTPDILTAEQIASYNQLRGYASTDPCANAPKGHNADRWKKHNGCD